jgi:hypothetical protein
LWKLAHDNDTVSVLDLRDFITIAGQSGFPVGVLASARLDTLGDIWDNVVVPLDGESLGTVPGTPTTTIVSSADVSVPGESDETMDQVVAPLDGGSLGTGVPGTPTPTLVSIDAVSVGQASIRTPSYWWTERGREVKAMEAMDSTMDGLYYHQSDCKAFGQNGLVKCTSEKRCAISLNRKVWFGKEIEKHAQKMRVTRSIAIQWHQLPPDAALDEFDPTFECDHESLQSTIVRRNLVNSNTCRCKRRCVMGNFHAVKRQRRAILELPVKRRLAAVVSQWTRPS